MFPFANLLIPQGRSACTTIATVAVMELLDLAAAGDKAEMGGRADGILTTGVAKYQSGHNTAAMGTQYDSFVDVYRRDATVQARLEVLGEADLPASDRVIAVRPILPAVWLQAVHHLTSCANLSLSQHTGHAHKQELIQGLARSRAEALSGSWRHWHHSHKVTVDRQLVSCDHCVWCRTNWEVTLRWAGRQRRFH